MSQAEFNDRIVLGYVIDVCAECGRHATFPFCEHRSSTQSWTVPVAVKVIHTVRASTDAARVRRRRRAERTTHSDAQSKEDSPV